MIQLISLISVINTLYKNALFCVNMYYLGVLKILVPYLYCWGGKLFLFPSKVLLAGLRIKLIRNRRIRTNQIKLIYIRTPHTLKFQRQKGKMRYVCHPELRNGIGPWSFKEEEDNLQGNKNSYLAIICLPCHTVGSLR